MKKIEFGLNKLKKDYKAIQKKYKLPDFNSLNENFEIEKLADRETDYLLREMRKIITEKALAFLRFLELMLNPSNAPFFMFSIIKNLTAPDKRVIEKIYKEMCGFEISAISLDLAYNEKKEAEFIKTSLKKWKNMESDLKELDKLINRAWNTASIKRNKDYFG